MRDQKHGYVCDFKKVDRWKLQQETAKVNRVFKYVKTNNITETNKRIKGVSIVVAENLGMKVNRQNDMGTRQRGRIKNRGGKEESRVILRRYKVKFQFCREKREVSSELIAIKLG